MAIMFAAFLYFMGIGLPAQWAPWFDALLPLASAFLYIMPGDDPFPASEDEPARIAAAGGGPRAKEFACVATAAVLVAATAGFARGVAAASGSLEQLALVGSVSTFFVFAGAVVICFLVNCGDAVRMIRASYAVLIFFGVVVAVLSIFGIDLGFLGIGKELLWMLLTCLMAYMVFRFGFSPVRAFGLGQAAYLVASAAAWGAGMSVADAFSSEAARIGAATVMVLAIVVVYVFVFSDSDLRFILTWRVGDSRTAPAPEGEGLPLPGQPGPEAGAPEGPGAPAGPDADDPAAPRELSLSERIALIDPRFGVSAREAEVMEYFAQGRSANWIAEELVISKNTVRSHLRSIYTKLDVHTRQELLDFLKTV